MRWNSMPQFQKTRQPLQLGLPKHLHIDPIICSTDYPAQGYRDNVQQLVLDILPPTWVADFSKISLDIVLWFCRHRLLLCGDYLLPRSICNCPSNQCKQVNADAVLETNFR